MEPSVFQKLPTFHLPPEIRVDDNGGGKILIGSSPSRLTMTLDRCDSDMGWQYLTLVIYPAFYKYRENNIPFYNDIIDIMNFYCNNGGSSIEEITQNRYVKI